jgi:hypothetical protein
MWGAIVVCGFLLKLFQKNVLKIWKKSWEPFGSYLLNSTANPAQFEWKWAGLRIDPLSISPSEPQFCARWTYIWQKNGQKRLYNGHLWVTFISDQSFSYTLGIFQEYLVKTQVPKYKNASSELTSVQDTLLFSPSLLFCSSSTWKCENREQPQCIAVFSMSRFRIFEVIEVKRGRWDFRLNLFF